MINYLKVNSGGARNLNLSNKVDNNTNYERKKIKYLILLIFVVMFTVTGGTYAYLAFTASNNTIVGTTATAGLDLVVERKLPSNVGVMVPQLEEYLDSAISSDHNCIDDNGNTVCQVYKATVTNTSTATVKVNGSISFTGIENMPNLKWKRLKDEETVGAYASYNASTSDAYFERNESFQPGESMTYYFVIWIDETKEVQTDNGTFRVTIEFNPATDGGLTSTIVPISYMTGFTSSTDYSYYRSDTYREKIKNVYFVDYINTTGSVESWDMSDLNMNGAGSVMAWVNTNTTDSNYYDLYIGAEQLIGGLDFSNLFRDMTSVESINFNNFDTRVTTNMSTMFYNCVSLTSLDVSGFDTSNVTDMRGIFYNCFALTSLDLSGFDTSKVTNMMYMFYNCVGLTSLDVSGFDTSKVTNMYGMFRNCVELTSLDISNFDTSNVTNMGEMFKDCINLTSLDVSDFDTSNVTNMKQMFYKCKGLTSLDVSKWDTSNVTNMIGMFQKCEKLTSLDVSRWDTSKVTDMSWMFGTDGENLMNLISLDVSEWDTSQVTSMRGMFYNCIKLPVLDISGFDTSNVKDMHNMFSGCEKLTIIDVSKWNTTNVLDMSYMFKDCINLTSLDVSKWNTGKVTDMSYMFLRCNKLVATITIKNVGTTTYIGMFNGTATESGSLITINYTSETSNLVDSMIATKPSNSNVVKGSLVS